MTTKSMTETERAVHEAAARKVRIIERFKRLGMSEAEAEVAALGRGPVTVPRDLKDIESGEQLKALVDRRTDPVSSREASFRRMGLSEAAARIAAQGREF